MDPPHDNDVEVDAQDDTISLADVSAVTRCRTQDLEVALLYDMLVSSALFIASVIDVYFF